MSLGDWPMTSHATGESTSCVVLLDDSDDALKAATATRRTTPPQKALHPIERT
jgi:hypothetical protein